MVWCRAGGARVSEAASSNLPLSGERLWSSLMEMARIGALPNGGCDRQALTDLDGEGRHLLRRWGEAAGLTLSVDRLGNMVLRREGRDPSRPPVAFGSHLDTCLLYTSPSPRDGLLSRMPSSA